MEKKYIRKCHKNFVEKVKKFHKDKKKLLKEIKEEYYCEEGGVIINVNLEKTEPFNSLSLGKQRTINPEIISFIKEKVYPIPSDIPVTIKFYGVNDEISKEDFEVALRKNFEMTLIDKKLDLKINLFKSISLFVIGLCLLAVYFFLESYVTSSVWYETLSIISSFIIWESADYYILDRHSLKLDYYEAAQLVLCQIVFNDENSK